jgi:hypothetical protein
VLLAGSAAKGTADAFSDLDVIVVWDGEPDGAFLEAAPLPGGDRLTNVVHPDGGRVEQYWVGDLKVDVASMRRSSVEELLDDVVVRFDPDPMKQKVCQGFAEGVALHGAPALEELRASHLASFPDGLVTALVGAHLRFVPLWAPLRMGLERGDLIAYYDLVLVDVRAVLAVLAALNRVWWSVTPEAKWNAHLLERCALAPDRTAARLQRLLAEPSAEAVADVDHLLREVVDLVEQHAPEVSTAAVRRVLDLELRACAEPPA